MEYGFRSSWKDWLGVLLSVVTSIIVVLWFQYPAQILFWFFAADIVIVTVYTLVQLLRFSSVKRALLLTGGFAALCTLIPLVLGSVAILITQNVVDFQTLTLEHISLIVPVFTSLVAYFYISRSSYFTTNYFDRYKIRIFLLFVFGTLCFGSWVAYSVFAFSTMFESYYFAGFVAYLLYKFAFDLLVYKLFLKNNTSWDFILRD